MLAVFKTGAVPKSLEMVRVLSSRDKKETQRVMNYLGVEGNIEDLLKQDDGLIILQKIKALLKNSSLGLVPLKNRVDYKISIPNKPIEYFSNDLPVMTSLTGELHDLIVNNQTGVFYENTSDMVNSIEHFMSNQGTLLKQQF